ncbi:hypothetical protein J3E68DRAFT_120558 [Trichoderma sp. SZMC 28012]
MLLTPMGGSVKPQTHSRSRLSGRLRLASDIEARVGSKPNQTKPPESSVGRCQLPKPSPPPVPVHAIPTINATSYHRPAI